RRRTTLLRVHVVDGPFILSTLTEELSRLGLDARDLLHPAFGVDRDPDGRLRRLLPARDAARREAYLAFDLGTELDEPRRTHVRQRVEAVLADAQAVVRDFEAMKERVAALADRLEADPPAAVDPEETAEAVALLRWLLADHFILLGARDYDVCDSADGQMTKATGGNGLDLRPDEELSAR